MLLLGIGSKFVPLTVNAVPATAIAGVNPLIVGAALVAVTRKASQVAELAGVVTRTVYEPATNPAGTIVTSCVAVADVTAVAVPPNVTAFCAGVVLKPVPKIVTLVPTGPV